jgi:hypothetical protein
MLRISRFGVAVAAFVGALAVGVASYAAPPPPGAPAITPDDLAAGMKAAPALVAAANIPCTVTAARMAGSGVTADKAQATFYEVACQQGMGYIIVSKAKVPAPIVFDCLMMAKPGPDGKVGALVCRLPANLNPGSGLQARVTQSGRACTVQNARFIDQTTDGKDLYEVACADGTGLILEVAATAPAAPVANNCLAYPPGSAIQCTLTTPAQEIAPVAALAASSGKCTMTKDRYMLSTVDGSDYYEVACTSSKGYVLHADKTGKLAETIPCAQAYEIGGGCTLTDARQAETQQDSVYTGLAKQAGFDCQVSKYGLFGQSDATKDIVELACGNRPDGGVGLFPAHGAAIVYDCLRSQVEGFKCTYTPVEAAYPHLSDQLRSLGKGSCVVSAGRPFARGDDGSDFVEVACADGGPGWVMVYPPNAAKASELRNCNEVANVEGGCQLPTNMKKK